MAKILITGGAGFIGSNLADSLTKTATNEVVVVDNLSTGFKSHVANPRIQFIRADVNDFCDLSGVFHGQAFDYIYHYAAVVGVDRTLKSPITVLKDIEGFRNVLNMAKNTGVKRVLFASSSEVYGEPVELPQHEETTPLNSRLPYAVVKNIGESYLRSYYQEYGLEFTIFSFFNTFGPRQSADFVMTKFIDAALKNEDITVYGDGKQSRTFCYVDDSVTATTNALHEKMAVNEVLNIGNDVEVQIVDLARQIIDLTGSKSNIVHLPALKEGDMTRRQPDINKMKKLLNRDFTPMEKGIQKLINLKKRSAKKG